MGSIRATPCNLSVVAIGAAAMLVTACATNTQTAGEPLAESAIRQAQAAGADTYASLEFDRAKVKMQQARALRQSKDHEQANRLEQQARVDAELAELKARSAKADKAMNELEENMRVLRQELERMGSS